MRKYYKTIIISDLHLGIKSSKAKEVVHFLKSHRSELLILNGDIIDGWQLKKSGSWKKRHTNFFKLLMKLITKDNTRVIYLRGNHDDFLDEIMPFSMGLFTIRRNYIHESGEKKYFILHGDIFDSITSQFKWLAKLGDIGYIFLLWLNRHYNNYRQKHNLPYYSLSQKVKQSVKMAVSFMDDFEHELCDMAKSKKCQGVITGHIHQPANKMVGSIHYLNSGDWVETMSALVETYEGEWKILYYQKEMEEELKVKAEFNALLNNEGEERKVLNF